MALCSCTGQILDSFRYDQQVETFQSEVEINTKIDLLWVIDNSSSMDVSQKSLREKFAGFARTYLKPYWDIRVAVITTDTYIAHPAFARWAGTQIPGSPGFRSYHLDQNMGSLSADKKTLLQGLNVTTSGTTGVFTNGMTYGDQVPVWKRGTDYARLLPGLHDGPITGLCIERLAYFLAGDDVANGVFGPQCFIRDLSNDVGPDKCIEPGAGESSVSQCVNTVLNDSVRSGKALIETQMPSSYTSGEDAWIEQLIRDFTVNISAGSSGSGSERGLGSVIEFINYNEASDSATKFFRPGAEHGIIFLTDEDDQTLPVPEASSVATGDLFTPDTYYVCDLASLAESNVIASDPSRDTLAEAEVWVRDTMKYCGTGAAYSVQAKSCPERTVDGLTYRLGVCPDETDATHGQPRSISSIKAELDTFFAALDNGTPNYFISVITPIKAASIASLQEARFKSDDRLGDLWFYAKSGASAPYTYSAIQRDRVRLRAVDIGQRYIDLANSVGNGSEVYDIAEPDYGTILDDIGLTLIQKKSSFQLTREASDKEQIILKVIHADKSQTEVSKDQYEVNGKVLVITDTAFVLALKATDKILIDYQPTSEN